MPSVIRLAQAGLALAALLALPPASVQAETQADGGKPWCPALRLARTQATPIGRCYQAWAEGLLARLGCALQVVDTGLANRGRRLEQFQRGELTMLLGMTRTPERDLIAHASQPYARTVMRLYVRRGEANRWPVAAICDPVMRKARLIGPTSGRQLQNYERELEAGGCLDQIAYFRSRNEQGAEMLIKDRADIMILGETQWLRLAPALRQKTEALALHFTPDTLHLLFRKASVPPAWMADLDRILGADLAEHGPPCDTMPMAAPE